MAENRQLFYSLALLLAAIIWGSTFFITKMATGSLSTAMILAIRFTVGALAIAVFCRKELRRLDGEYLRWGFLLGVVTFAAYGVHIFGLELDTTPGKSAFLTSIYCVLVPFIYWALGNSRPDGYNFAASFLCLGGIGLVSLQSGTDMLRGDLYTLAGGCLGALEIVAVGLACRGRDPLLLTCLQLVFVAVLSWLLVLFQGAWPATFVPGDVGGIVYLGLFATAGCLGLQSIGIKNSDPSSAAIILSLEAVFGVLFSVIFYQEAVTSRMLLGFGLIFIAVVLSETKLRFLRPKCRAGREKRVRQDHETGAVK